MRPLLEQAADILEDKLLEEAKWDTVKTTDDAAEVVYYHTTTSALATFADTVVFDRLHVQADRVRIYSIV